MASERKESDLKLIDDAWKIAQNKSKSGYERLYAVLAAKVFEKKVKSGAGVQRRNNLLSKMYYNPETGYGSIKALTRKTKLSMPVVKSWLTEQDVYSKHKPVIERFKHRRVYAKGIDSQWQADLADMSNLK